MEFDLMTCKRGIVYSINKHIPFIKPSRVRWDIFTRAVCTSHKLNSKLSVDELSCNLWISIVHIQVSLCLQWSCKIFNFCIHPVTMWHLFHVIHSWYFDLFCLFTINCLSTSMTRHAYAYTHWLFLFFVTSECGCIWVSVHAHAHVCIHTEALTHCRQCY